MKGKQKILLLGANGQLGKTFQQLSTSYPELELKGVDVPEIDFLNASEAIPTIIKQYDPDVCINCAAHTAVDLAEEEEIKAQKINVDAIGILAQACKLLGTTLIHFSTDYVFDGSKSVAYSEEDAPNPLSVYGRTKWEGEQAILKSGVNHLIFRTSWLYSDYGKNFVGTMQRLGAERDRLTVVDDQIGSPTCARDLVKLVFDWVESGISLEDYGLYHYSNEGVATWYDFACAIMEYSGLPCVVEPISSEAFSQKAKRPPFSLLNKTKVKEKRGVSIPHWRASLQALLS